MYKTLVRAQVRRNLARLNAGDHGPLSRAAAADAELCFPGDNSWSRQFRPVRKGRAASVTHRGTAELEAFAQRFVDLGLRLDVEDILVAGPPWRTRICVRATDSVDDHDGHGVYVNRVVVFIEARWGVIRRWEDYLDTERVHDWDARLEAGEAPADQLEPA
ncbi:MAG: hypothetical protein GEV08_06820 [Acidimicrobiia bacterium]|nr:hypothetical protein [Acidimicrobiia bacterium]